jgi:hypothetical protein
MTTEVDPITNIAIVNEFVIDCDDYHEFVNIKQTLMKTVGLMFTYKELDPVKGGKPYRAKFFLKGIKFPAQYSADIE